MYKARTFALLICVVFLTFLFFEAAYPGRSALPALSEAQAAEILRLHVVANSDSESDQAIKRHVRDAILAKFAPANSLDEARIIVLKNGRDVQKTVDEVLKAEGAGYGASLRYGLMHFPKKTYGKQEYPEGDYEALKIELGKACGENWWCVIFPPLCLVDIGVEKLKDTDEIVFESDILRLIKKWRKR